MLNTVLAHKAFQLLQERFIQRGGPTQIQGESVQDERITLGEGAELLAQCTTEAHPVFRCHFHEINIRWRLPGERTQQGPPQTEAGAMEWCAMHIHGAVPVLLVAAALGFAALGFLDGLGLGRFLGTAFALVDALAGTALTFLRDLL